jgi:hypothetical protein
MAVQIQLRNGTAAQWTSANPTLAIGEMGVETDTNKFKIGTGSTVWNSLAYAFPSVSLPLTNNGVVYANSTSGLTTGSGITFDGTTITVSGMYGTTVSTPRNVFVDSSGKLGGISSTRASKINIAALQNTNWIYQLNPVTFNYRKKDEQGAFLEEFETEQQFGLIAEDVELVKPELCIYVDDKLQGIHYDRMIAPLIKVIQEQQTLIQSLIERVAQLEAK